MQHLDVLCITFELVIEASTSRRNLPGLHRRCLEWKLARDRCFTEDCRLESQLSRLSLPSVIINPSDIAPGSGRYCASGLHTTCFGGGGARRVDRAGPVLPLCYGRESGFVVGDR